MIFNIPDIEKPELYFINTNSRIREYVYKYLNLINSPKMV